MAYDSRAKCLKGGLRSNYGLSLEKAKAVERNREWGKQLSPEELLNLRDFYEAIGSHAIAAGGVVWFVAGSFSLCTTPTMLLPDLPEKEVRALLWKTKKLAAVYGVLEDEGTTVPMYVLRNKSYDFKNLQRQFRQHVVRAQKILEARECSWREWEAAAVRCDEETLLRRGMNSKVSHPLLSPQGRSKVVRIAERIPDLRIQACFYGSEIVSYLVHLTMGPVCEGLMMHRRDDRVDVACKDASHLVYFTFAKAAMARPEIRLVCVGRQSVPAKDALARFKLHAGFEEFAYPLRFRLHSWIAPAFENRVGARILRAVRERMGGRVPALENLEVMERASLRSNR